MPSRKPMSVSVHRVNVEELKLKARHHGSTYWIVIEFDEDHEVTIFAKSEEDYRALIDQFQITDEETSQ
jgi:hypothetical protein